MRCNCPKEFCAANMALAFMAGISIGSILVLVLR